MKRLLAATVGLILLADPAGGEARAQIARALREAAIVENFEVDESTFHQWIFGAGNKITSTPDLLEAQLMIAVADVDRPCGLSDDQRRKLILAGRGDKKRFLDRVADAHRVYDRLKYDQSSVPEILASTKPLAEDFAAGLFGEGSFFAKSLASTLTPEQVGLYRQSKLDRLAFRYRAKLRLVLASLENSVGLSTRQTRGLFELAVEETNPPARMSPANEQYVVLIRLAHLPEDKVKALVDEGQWWKLDQIFKRARSWEDSLRASGDLD